jgi:hypothetical protein
MTRKERRIENLFCILAGLLSALVYLAIFLGYGRSGILDLF